MPDSCSRCGEPIAPAERITLHAASARSGTGLAREFDPDRAPAVEDHAMHQRVGDDPQVRPLFRGAEVGRRGAGAAAPAPGLLANDLQPLWRVLGVWPFSKWDHEFESAFLQRRVLSLQ